MKKLVLFLIFLSLSTKEGLTKKVTISSPVDYVESLINYCTGRSQLDFCSKEQIEFGLLYLLQYQRKIQQEIELEKQKMKKQTRIKHIGELKQLKLRQKLREHFLDRHL